MRIFWAMGLLALASTGCTSHQLQRSTVNQASTLSDLQFQQVLDNLAMFAANPSAIPWQVALKNGSSQVADSGSATVTGSFGNMMGRLATGSPGAAGSRTIVEQWGTVPITDDSELRILRIAYRRALGYPDTLDDNDFANDLAHDLKQQVSVTDDFKPLNDNLYKDEQTLAEVDRLAQDLDRVGIPRRKNEILNELVLATNDDRIIQEGESATSPDFEPSRPKAVKLGAALKLSDEEKRIARARVDAINKADPLAFMTNPTDVLYRKIPTPLIQEVRRLVKGVADDLSSIEAVGFGVGSRKDEVPRDACFVGHYRDRCGERYVWVCPDRRAELTEFTLTILSLSSLIQDRQVVTVPGGPAYAPSSAYLGR